MPIFVYMNKRDEWYETGKVVQQAAINHLSSALLIFARRESYPLCTRYESQGLFIAISDAVFTKLAALIPYMWILRRLYGKYTSCATPAAYVRSRTAPPPLLFLSYMLLRLSTWQPFARAYGRILRAAGLTARRQVRACGQVVRDRTDLRADVTEHLLGRRRWLPNGVRERYVCDYYNEAERN